MTDEQIDQLVADAASYDEAAVLALDLHGAEQALLEEIMSTSVPRQGEQTQQDELFGPLVPGGPRRALADRPPGRPRRRRRAVAVLSALAVAAVLAGAMVLPSLVSPDDPTSGHAGTDGRSRTTTSFSVAARQVAEANPRLLVTAPGWRVTHVEEFVATDGEMRFTAGRRELDVNWRPADQRPGYVEDRRDVSRPEPVRVLGAAGLMYTYNPRDFAVILPVQGDVFVELRGSGADRAGFLAVLESLRAVSVDRWLSAMPASVVTPNDEVEVATEMLADVPVPAGFDPASLPTGGTNDYYQYGARVSGTVTCAWIAAWQQSRADGDRAGVRRAADALTSSHRWRVLQRMNAEGDYPEVVWEIADQVAAGTVPAEYKAGLGCD